MHIKVILLAGIILPVFCIGTVYGYGGEEDHPPITEIESLETKADFEEAVVVLKDRLQELKTERKSARTAVEKEAVKKEIRGVKKEVKAVKAKAVSGGIYIGGTALVVVLLLLLLL